MQTKAIGRPTDYSLQLAERICDVLCSSDATIATVAGMDGMPARATIFRWLAKHAEFRDLYIRAREFQTELLYDDMADIADAPFDEVDVYDALGNFVGRKVDAGAAMAEMQRRKLQVDVIKFKLMKLQARRFGDNKNVDLNVKVNHSVSSEQYRQLLATAAAAPRIEAPEVHYLEFEEAVQESGADGMSADEFDSMVDDDDLG